MKESFATRKKRIIGIGELTSQHRPIPSDWCLILCYPETLQFNRQNSFSNEYWDFQRTYAIITSKMYLCSLIHSTEVSLLACPTNSSAANPKVDFSFLSSISLQLLLLPKTQRMLLSLCAFAWLFPLLWILFSLYFIFAFSQMSSSYTNSPSKIVCFTVLS